MRPISSRFLVLTLFLGSMLFVVVYRLIVDDDNLLSNILAEVFGLGLSLPVVYLIIERRFQEERTSLLRPVVADVLDLVLNDTIAAARVVGMLAGRSEFSPEWDEKTDIQPIESFAKAVCAREIRVSPPKTALTRFVPMLKDIDERIYALQRDYPQVFGEQIGLSQALIRLRIAELRLEHNAYTAEAMLGSVPQDWTERIADAFQEYMTALDEIAEELSRVLKGVRPRLE